MSEVLEFAARLSTVIGPRPAGTEEEQQASFFIEEVMTEAGLDTSVEEFNCNPNYEMPRIVCCIASIVFAILAICLPLMVLPAMIVCLVAAVLYILDMLGSSPLNKLIKGGVSQNVIAKYYPGMSASSNANGEFGDGTTLDKIDGKSSGDRHRVRGVSADGRAHRKRKIVILARYDTGKVRAELRPPFLGVLDKIHWVEIGGMALVPVVLFLRLVTGGVEEGHLVWDILTGIGTLCSLLPVIAYIMHQTAAYNEGANNNASGVAVMTELAKRLIASTKPSLSSKVLPDADGLSYTLPTDPEDPTVIAAIPELGSSSSLPIFHGKDAVAAAGVLPVDTDLIYDEAANGDLERKNRKRLEFMEEERSSDATMAFTPVNPDQKEEEGLSSRSLRNGRQSALSLEAQIKSASQEFAKFDGQSDGDHAVENQLLRPQDEVIEEQTEFVAADATGDLLGAQTITIAENEPKDDPNVPDWFKKGMAAASANKDEGDGERHKVQRSKFADALDAAHETSAQAIGNLEGKSATLDSDIDRARLSELQAKIMGESPKSASFRGKGIDSSDEAKEARKAKLLAARNSRNDTEEALAEEAIEAERQELEEMADELETAAAIESKLAAQAAAQAQAAEEVAEQAAVADRTISFIPVAADIPSDVTAKSASETGSHEPIKKTAEEILEDAASLTGSRRAVSADEDLERKGRRSISLPSLTVSGGKKGALQNAPLADDAERGKNEARTALKGIGGETGYDSNSSKVSGTKDGQNEGVSRSLEGATTSFLEANAEADAKAALSSLDESTSSSKKKPVVRKSDKASQSNQVNIPTITNPSINLTGEPVKTDSPITVSTAGSFVQPSQTSNFRPVGDELIANMESKDIIVEDVDDSDYTENITHTGAIAGPGYVEMPKSRMHRIKSLFGKKKSKDEDSVSFSDAVGLEEGFDAREIGKARGGWESFKDNSSNFSSNGKETANSGSLDQRQPIEAGKQPLGAQMPAKFQGAPQPYGQPQGNSRDLPQGIPQNGQGARPNMSVQGASMSGQPNAQGMPPMQGQPPMQGRPMQQMPPMQGRPMQQMLPQQGQFPQQFQQQMQFNAQGQPIMQGQPNAQGMPPMQGVPMQGQPPMQGRPMQQMPMQGQPPMQGKAPVQGQSMPPKNQGDQHQGVAISESESTSAEIVEEKPGKSHSFSFFKRKNRDGDMNSGAFDDDDWNGGAFSLGRNKDSEEGASRRSRKASHGSSRVGRGQSASSGRRKSADEVLAEEARAELSEDELMAQDMLDERDQIRNFRSSSSQLTSFEEVAAFASSFSKQDDDVHGTSDAANAEPDIGFQTEVWFVALGAELADNAGIKNLLAEHGDEMRGAVVIDIDALGAGQLSVIEEEGVLKRVKSSSRMRRYATKAATAIGLKLGSGKMLWRESAAYYATKRGLLTMHLCGMEGGKPAYVGEIDDTFDKLNEETLLENTAFLLELINAI